MVGEELEREVEAGAKGGVAAGGSIMGVGAEGATTGGSTGNGVTAGGATAGGAMVGGAMVGGAMVGGAMGGGAKGEMVTGGAMAGGASTGAIAGAAEGDATGTCLVDADSGGSTGAGPEVGWVALGSKAKALFSYPDWFSVGRTEMFSQVPPQIPTVASPSFQSDQSDQVTVT